MIKKLDIPVYRQSTSYSCGAASLLMILNYFDKNKFPLTVQKEMEIHAESYYGKYGGNEEFYYDYLSTTYPGLALYALNNGFKAKLYQKYPRFMYTATWPRWVFNDMLRIYNLYLSQAKDAGLEFMVGEFGTKELICDLKKNRPSVILLPKASSLHNTVISGTDGKVLYRVDPTAGHLTELAINVDKGMDSLEFGKVALCVYK